jgi:MAPEG family
MLRFALLKRLGIPFAATLVASYAERVLLRKTSLGFLLEETPPLGVPRGFGLTTAVLALTTFWLLFYGFLVVGSARSKYMDLARKDGELNVEERYGLPNLYAQGTTKHVIAFNSVQRSHQQILESYPGYLLMALLASIYFPLLAAIHCALWLYSRIVWTRGYATGNSPKDRYSHPHSRLFWTNMTALFLLSLLSSVNLVAGYAFFWDVVG